VDGDGIPATVLTTPEAAGDIAGGTAALAALERVGLLTVVPDTAPPTVRISPVLQDALRAAMPPAMLDRTTRVAADALLAAWAAWPADEQPSWPASGLRSGVAALRQNTGNRLWAGGCHPVLLRAGDSLDRARLTGPAADHWLDLVTTSDQLLDTEAVRLGPDHPDLIGPRIRLGHALVAAGQPQQAVSVLERAASGADRVRGPGQADTLGGRDELAAAYLAAGRPSDAVTLYRNVLASRERAQGPRDPETMTTRLGLADAYLADGQEKEAVAAYKRVVGDRERVLGPHHLDTVRAWSSLGAAYQRMGKTVAAERLYEQARAGFEQLLGPRHPDALRSRAELARIYHKLGRYGDARALLRGTVGRLQRILPGDDPLILDLRAILTDIGDD
jgi:tetratricopeptide (TPR) repeat protein